MAWSGIFNYPNMMPYQAVCTLVQSLEQLERNTLPLPTPNVEIAITLTKEKSDQLASKVTSIPLPSRLDFTQHTESAKSASPQRMRPGAASPLKNNQFSSRNETPISLSSQIKRSTPEILPLDSKYSHAETFVTHGAKVLASPHLTKLKPQVKRIPLKETSMTPMVSITSLHTDDIVLLRHSLEIPRIFSPRIVASLETVEACKLRGECEVNTK